jgi:hypothetical protein
MPTKMDLMIQAMISEITAANAYMKSIKLTEPQNDSMSPSAIGPFAYFFDEKPLPLCCTSEPGPGVPLRDDD